MKGEREREKAQGQKAISGKDWLYITPVSGSCACSIVHTGYISFMFLRNMFLCDRYSFVNLIMTSSLVYPYLRMSGEEPSAQRKYILQGLFVEVVLDPPTAHNPHGLLIAVDQALVAQGVRQTPPGVAAATPAEQVRLQPLAVLPV